MKNLIGLTGRAQSGKDTVGAILVESYGFTRFAFADTLKSMALVLDPYIEPGIRLSQLLDIGGWEYAKQNPEVRRFLQVLGTEGVRSHLGANTWVDALARRLIAFGSWGWPGLPTYIVSQQSVYVEPPAVITDVRFPNEVEAVRSWGGSIWKLRREGVPLLDHESETNVDAIKADVTIYNDSTLEDLRDWVGVAIEYPDDDPLVIGRAEDILMRRYQ